MMIMDQGGLHINPNTGNYFLNMKLDRLQLTNSFPLIKLDMTWKKQFNYEIRNKKNRTESLCQIIN